MKLILLQKIENLGDEGDVIDVKEGYARNFLLPKKLAIEATKGSLTQIEILKRKKKQREEKELDEIRQLQKKVDGLRLEFMRKAGDKGKLYGSVTSKEIADKIGEILQLELDRKFIDLPEPIKEIGETEVKLHFGRSIYGSVQVQIVPEEGAQSDDSKEVKEP